MQDTPLSEDEIFAAIGKQISVARKLRRWTQHMLADQAGVSRGTINQLERDPDCVASMQVKTLAKILTALQLEQTLLSIASLAEDRIGKEEIQSMLPKRITGAAPLSGVDL